MAAIGAALISYLRHINNLCLWCVFCDVLDVLILLLFFIALATGTAVDVYVFEPVCSTRIDSFNQFILGMLSRSPSVLA